jgi:protein-disulfide isomerase
MKLMRLSIIIAMGLLALAVAAQTPRKRASPRSGPTKAEVKQQIPVPAPTPTSPKPRPPQPPLQLVIVNGQTLTTADIDPSVRTASETLDDKIAEARKQVLELQINTILLNIEAKKRRLSSQQIYDAEVTRRITEPTEAEINDFIARNQKQLEPSDNLRSQVKGILRGESEAKLSDILVQRLRKTTPVVMGVDFNTPGLSPAVVVATVAGQPISAGDLNERLKPIIYKMRLSIYESQKQAAEQTINDILLLSEANRRNIGPEEIIRSEVSQKVRPPTEAEVRKFYSENRERINGDFEGMRHRIALYLQDEDQRRLERALSERLRKGANIRWLISEPAPPVQLISVDDDPSRGGPNAPVTVVEFTDFQCPACAAMQPVIDEVLKTYGDKVRFVVRDFPLPTHANARKAAEAANAAHAQGKFFEYAALLFKRQNALDNGSLKKYASELGLDRKRFDAALDNGAYAAEVSHDIQHGEIYGIDSTPTIFINGVKLRTLSAEALRTSIDGALGGPNRSSTSPGSQ